MFEQADQELREWMSLHTYAPPEELERISEAASEIHSRHALDRAEVERVLREVMDGSADSQLGGMIARVYLKEAAHRFGITLEATGETKHGES